MKKQVNVNRLFYQYVLIPFRVTSNIVSFFDVRYRYYEWCHHQCLTSIHRNQNIDVFDVSMSMSHHYYRGSIQKMIQFVVYVWSENVSRTTPVSGQIVVHNTAIHSFIYFKGHIIKDNKKKPKASAAVTRIGNCLFPRVKHVIFPNRSPCVQAWRPD